MTTSEELRIVRRVYAKQIVHAARASDPRLEEALAELVCNSLRVDGE
jgi:hypothetical protein